MFSNITIQVELIWSLVIMFLMGVFFVYAGKKVKAADPTARPTGIVLVCETGVSMIYGYLKGIMPAKFEKNYFPYFSMLFAFILISNISGLLGIEAPTSNYSITLSLTLITWVLIQWNAIQKQGLFPFIKGKLLPPTEILSMMSPLISLSMRLFGNILSGSIIMYLLYSLLSWLSGVITLGMVHFNFLGIIIAPVFHCYFDLFSGCIQTLVFVTLSAIFIMMENQDD